MSASRREVMMGVAAGLGATGIAATASAATGAATAQAVKALREDGRLPVNRERAYKLMKEAGIDALVGAGEFNSRYLTNMRSVMSEMGMPFRIIGVMPADPSKPIIAIMPSVDIGRHTTPGREWPELVTYSGPSNVELYANLTNIPAGQDVPAVPARFWPADESAKLNDIEKLWEENSAKRPTMNAASPELALRKVLQELGLSKARIGIDEPAIADALAQYGMAEIKPVPADNLFRKLRMVKSPVELDRMRTVSKLNSEAGRATMQRLALGMEFEDVQAVFFEELAKRGGRPAFLVAGMTSGLRSGRLVKHEPFLIDCVGRFQGYCGDFARTLVFGTPPKELEKRSKIIGQLAQATFETLKPGVKYSEIRAVGAATLKKLGGDFQVGVGPHSVGMQHSDDAGRDDMPFPVRADTVLEAGMVITVDLPTLEPGWGSTHMESLILITKDGAEWLDKHDDPLYELVA
jgi:Xaa-Pro aminopeptidase